MLPVIYLTGTLLTLWATRKERICLVAMVGLLMWMALANMVYQFNVTEVAGTYVTTSIFILYGVLAGHFFRHWLFMVMVMFGMATLLWTMQEAVPYVFKDVKNKIYIASVLSVWIAFLQYRWASVLSWLHSGIWSTKS